MRKVGQSIPGWRYGSKFSELSFYIIMSLYTKFGLPANFSSIFLNFTSYLINYSWKWRHHESCHQKKCVCHEPYTIEMTLRQKLAKKILCWKIARCIHLSAPLIKWFSFHFLTELGQDDLVMIINNASQVWQRNH